MIAQVLLSVLSGSMSHRPQPSAGLPSKSLPIAGVVIDLSVFPGESSASASAISADGSTVIGTADYWPVGMGFRWRESTASSP
jgi:hypothetical protein